MWKQQCQHDFISAFENFRSKAHEQKAIALLQKNIRGVITRKRIKQELKASFTRPELLA